MNKKTKKYILISGVILVLVGLFIIFKTSNNKLKDNERFSNEYGEVGQNNVFVYRNVDEIIKILEGGTGLVYFGFPECPWCQAYVPMLNEVAKEEGVEKIYYYNIKNIRSENTAEYQKIVKLLKNFLPKDDEGNERVFVPDVYAVKEGKILSHNNDTSMISSDITPTEYWTDAKRKEIKNVFKSMIEETYSNVCKTCGD
ncbi:MAG: thioredoxin family protein [Bacilli bacterium]|nr:thioredoxin family protein [Bacilli bacterium]